MFYNGKILKEHDNQIEMKKFCKKRRNHEVAGETTVHDRHLSSGVQTHTGVPF